MGNHKFSVIARFIELLQLETSLCRNLFINCIDFHWNSVYVLVNIPFSIDLWHNKHTASKRTVSWSAQPRTKDGQMIPTRSSVELALLKSLKVFTKKSLNAFIRNLFQNPNIVVPCGCSVMEIFRVWPLFGSKNGQAVQRLRVRLDYCGRVALW